MLRIHIGSITEQGVDLNEQQDAAFLPLLNALSSKESVSFTHPVQVRIHATPAGETILVKGSAESTVRIPCSRCLELFDFNLETTISVTAVPEVPSLNDSETTDDIELTAEDMDVIRFSGNSIDLSDEIAQQIIMALPFKPLCRDTCKGLCSRCGANLNNFACQCLSQEKSNPFAVLKGLSFPKRKE